MNFTITAKVRILPTDEQAAQLEQTMRTYRDACNYVSEYIFDTHVLSVGKINDALYYKLRAKFGLGAQMAQSIIRTVVAKYKTIAEQRKKRAEQIATQQKKGKKGKVRKPMDEWIQPYFKKPQCDLVWNRDYSLSEWGFSVNTLKGRVRIKFDPQGMEHFFVKGWEFGTAKLVFKHGKWFLHISVTTEISDVTIDQIKNVTGVDLGMNFLCVSYDGNGTTHFVSGKKVKHKRAQYKKLRRELQRRQTPSARRRLKKIGSRENRWMTDVNHQASKALVNRSPAKTLFVLEDLTGIRDTTELVRLKDRAVQVSWAFYQLRAFITYKAVRSGRAVVLVDPAYTSQTCPKCGHVERSNRNKNKHEFKCKSCGYRSNDDRAAAMNLQAKGIEYLVAVLGQACPA